MKPRELARREQVEGGEIAALFNFSNLNIYDFCLLVKLAQVLDSRSIEDRRKIDRQLRYIQEAARISRPLL